jgi:glycosyltransferase involved in cell wall biosynthesis
MKLKENPKVLLLMLTYNHEDCVLNAIASILDQTYDNFELYIFDDYSTDSTYSILDEVAKKNPKIKVRRNEENLGMFKNLETSMKIISEQTDWEYFAWLCPDDIWSKYWLESLVSALLQSKEVGLAQSFVSYKKYEREEIRTYETLERDHLSYASSIELRKGYGQLIHGLWRRNLFLYALNMSRKIPLERLLKIENVFTAILIEYAGFESVPACLHTKNKHLGSTNRYTGIEYFGSPHRIFLPLLLSLFGIMKLILNTRAKSRFLFGALLIEFRLILNVSVRFKADLN